MINEDIKLEFILKYQAIKKTYSTNANSRNQRERVTAKKLYNNDKLKLFIEYMDYKEEVCSALYDIPQCYAESFANRTGCPVPEGDGCKNCCAEGRMYNFLMNKINTPYIAI